MFQIIGAMAEFERFANPGTGQGRSAQCARQGQEVWKAARSSGRLRSGRTALREKMSTFVIIEVLKLRVVQGVETRNLRMPVLEEEPLAHGSQI
jgi:hypothetical protein